MSNLETILQFCDIFKMHFKTGQVMTESVASYFRWFFFIISFIFLHSISVIRVHWHFLYVIKSFLIWRNCFSKIVSIITEIKEPMGVLSIPYRMTILLSSYCIENVMKTILTWKILYSIIINQFICATRNTDFKSLLD